MWVYFSTTVASEALTGLVAYSPVKSSGAKIGRRCYYGVCFFSFPVTVYYSFAIYHVDHNLTVHIKICKRKYDLQWQNKAVVIV